MLLRAGDGYSPSQPVFRSSMACAAYLTCSETSFVVPASSSHLPKNSSPRKGFNGFFSEPSSSLRLLYCCFRVLRNHFSTSKARFAGSSSEAGATKIDGCSAQYEENSTSEVVPRMKGGAVREARSPLKEAMDLRCFSMALWVVCMGADEEAGMACGLLGTNAVALLTYLDERHPAGLVLRSHTGAFLLRRRHFADCLWAIDIAVLGNEAM